MSRRRGESAEDYLVRKREDERRRRADPVLGARIRENSRARYAKGGRERQNAYYAKLRAERFFHWRARLWSSRWKVTVTEAQLIELWEAQAARCALSGRPLGADAHLDHVVPSSLGGTHTIENLRWLDPVVNVMRQNLTDAEFLAVCREIVEALG